MVRIATDFCCTNNACAHCMSAHVHVCACPCLCVCLGLPLFCFVFFHSKISLGQLSKKKIPDVLFQGMNGSRRQTLQLGPPSLSSDPSAASGWGNRSRKSNDLPNLIITNSWSEGSALHINLDGVRSGEEQLQGGKD